jgi:hypothetical protein
MLSWKQPERSYGGSIDPHVFRYIMHNFENHIIRQRIVKTEINEFEYALRNPTQFSIKISNIQEYINRKNPFDKETDFKTRAIEIELVVHTLRFLHDDAALLWNRYYELVAKLHNRICMDRNPLAAWESIFDSTAKEYAWQWYWYNVLYMIIDHMGAVQQFRMKCINRLKTRMRMNPFFGKECSKQLNVILNRFRSKRIVNREDPCMIYAIKTLSSYDTLRQTDNTSQDITTIQIARPPATPAVQLLPPSHASSQNSSTTATTPDSLQIARAQPSTHLLTSSRRSNSWKGFYVNRRITKR